MSKSARRRANQQVDAYWPTVMAALESEDFSLVDKSQFEAVPCPVCGNLILGSCAHYPRDDYR